jgi:hypothetical protein
VRCLVFANSPPSALNQEGGEQSGALWHRSYKDMLVRGVRAVADRS